MRAGGEQGGGCGCARGCLCHTPPQREQREQRERGAGRHAQSRESGLLGERAPTACRHPPRAAPLLLRPHTPTPAPALSHTHPRPPCLCAS
eukprot:2474143-Rhodomonas_salina.1